MFEVPLVAVKGAGAPTAVFCVAGCVAKQGDKAHGRVTPPVVLLKSALAPVAVLLLPVELKSRSRTDGRVAEAGGVEIERLNTMGRVVVAGGVVLQRLPADGRVEASWAPVVLQ